MATYPPIPENIAEIAGTLFIACVLNWTLFGVLCLQVYLYFEGYPHDNICIKVMVYFVFALEIVQSVLFMDSVFYSLARGFGNMAALDRIGTIWLSVPLIDGLVACIVQSFYGYRVYVLSRSKILTVVIYFLALLQFVAAIVTAAAGSRAGTFSNLLKTNVLISNSIWEGGSALCDIVIAVTMTYVLKTRDSGAIKTTHELITRIIRLTIETGALTAVVSIIALILTFVPPEKRYYQVAVVVLGKLYSTTLMVLLNIRPRRQPGGTICCCGNLVGDSKGGSKGRGVAVTRGVSIHQEVQISTGDVQGAETIPTQNTRGLQAGSLNGTSRRTKRGPAGVGADADADADASRTSRRKALYVPADADTKMSVSSTGHVSESEGSMTFELMHSTEKGVVGEIEEPETKLNETAFDGSGCMSLNKACPV